jgi:hypothetical protein
MVWQITPEELLARYNAGERDFNGIELLRVPERHGIAGPIEGIEGADLREINLRGANLKDICLNGANLTRADLFGASLISACMADAIFRDANLFSANLNWAGCHRSDFTGARMNQMNACSANFIDAILTPFEYTILAFTNFQGARGRESIRGHFNVIWETTMPDGSVILGPECLWK